MGLSLALPAMLLGLGLLALPITAHLTGYAELKTVEFPTLRFLRASQLKVRRRTRVQSLLLLLVRCAAVAAVVLLLSRPSLTWTAHALSGLEPATTSVVVLDRSASMSLAAGEGLVFDRARAEAKQLLEGLAPGTLAALVTFDSRADVVAPGLTADRAPLLAELARLEPGAGSTHLDGVLRRARELLRDAGVARANLFVLTDGTATTPPAGLRDWPEGLIVHYHDLLGEVPPNRWVADARSTAGLRAGEGIKLRATAARQRGTAASTPIELATDDGMNVFADLQWADNEGAATFTLPLPPSGRVAATLSLPEDALALDDRLAFTLAGDTDLSVLLVSGDGGNNPRDNEVYFLSRALQPGPGSPSRVRPRVVAAEELRRIDGRRGDVIFLCNVADPGPLAPELLAFVRGGGGLFLSVGNRVDPDRYNDLLGELLPARFSEVKTRGIGTFEQSPMGLALPPLDEDEFRVFRTGGASVFSQVRFGRVLGTEPRLEPDSRVLLRYSDGLPALLERRVGEGRVVVFTSTVDDDWTDLPLRAVFPTLAHQFARSLSDTLLLDGGHVVSVGGTVMLPLPVDAGEGAWVQGPAGDEIPLERGAADAEGRVPFRQTDRPGHYRLFWAGSDGAGELRSVFAVQVPPDESALRPVGRDELLAAVPGLHHHGAGDDAKAQAPARVVRTASLAPALLGLLLLALVGEGVFGGRRA